MASREEILADFQVNQVNLTRNIFMSMLMKNVVDTFSTSKKYRIVPQPIKLWKDKMLCHASLIYNCYDVDFLNDINEMYSCL